MSQLTDNKSARKFWWIIMILPIGLVIGTVTSVVNHLRQNEEQEAQLEFQVAVALNAKDIDSTMERSLLIGNRHTDTESGRNNIQTVNRFIQGSVSPGGTGIQFSEINLSVNDNRKIQLSYADISGTKKNEFVVLVMELSGKRGRADAARIGLTPSLIRSLTEAKPLYSLRFVLSPETKRAEQHAETIRKHTFSSHKQKVRKVIVLKEQDNVDITDPNDWKILASQPAQLASNSDSHFINITHPVLRKNTTEQITPEFSKSTLKAADQLRVLLLKLAN